jgi:hypothetical protein
MAASLGLTEAQFIDTIEREFPETAAGLAQMPGSSTATRRLAIRQGGTRTRTLKDLPIAAFGWFDIFGALLGAMAAWICRCPGQADHRATRFIQHPEEEPMKVGTWSCSSLSSRLASACGDDEDDSSTPPVCRNVRGTWTNTGNGTTGPATIAITVDEKAKTASLTLDLAGTTWARRPARRDHRRRIR